MEHTLILQTWPRWQTQRGAGEGAQPGRGRQDREQDEGGEEGGQGQCWDDDGQVRQLLRGRDGGEEVL